MSDSPEVDDAKDVLLAGAQLTAAQAKMLTAAGSIAAKRDQLAANLAALRHDHEEMRKALAARTADFDAAVRKGDELAGQVALAKAEAAQWKAEAEKAGALVVSLERELTALRPKPAKFAQELEPL